MNENQFSQAQPMQQTPYGYQMQSIDEVITIKEWLITLLIMCIPLVNIVMIFVWAFGGGTKTSKANFFKAQLVFLLIGVILWVLFVLAFGASLASLSNL